MADKKKLDPRFNNTFYRGLRDEVRELNARWGLAGNAAEKSRKMLSRAQELLSGAAPGRRADALQSFVRDEQAVPTPNPSAMDRFKQRLDFKQAQLQNYRPQWGVSQFPQRNPDDVTFEHPSNIYIENVHRGKRQTEGLNYALDALTKNKEGWSWRYMDAGNNTPSHVELTMGRKDGNPIVRQMFFPTAGTTLVGRERNGRTEDVRMAMSALITDKGSNSYNAITPSVVPTGKDEDGNLSFRYRSLRENIASFFSGHNIYKNYGATKDRKTQTAAYEGAPLQFDMRRSNSPHASRYLTQVSLGVLPSGKALDVEESQQATSFLNSFLSQNALPNEPGWRAQNVVGKGNVSSVGPIEPATTAGAVTKRDSLDYYVDLYKAHKHNFLTNKSRGSGAILYDERGVRPTRTQLAHSPEATGAFSGPATSSAYFMKRWGFGEGQSFSVPGRTFVGEHQSVIVRGLRPDQLPQRVGDTYYANDRIGYPMPAGGRLMPKSRSIGYSDFGMGNADQMIVSGLDWIAENQYTRMDMMSVSDLAYQTEAKNYSDKSVSTPVTADHPYFRALRERFGSDPDMIHPLPDPGNRFTGKSEFLWMNQAAQPQQDRVRDTVAMLDQFYAQLDAAQIGDAGMISLMGGKVPGSIRRKDGKYVAVAGKHEVPLENLLTQTRSSDFDAGTEVPRMWVGFNTSAADFAHKASRKYVMDNLHDVHVKDVNTSHWMVAEKAAQDIAKEKKIAVSEVKDSDIRAWMDKEFTDATYIFHDQSRAPVSASALDSFGNRNDGFWQVSYNDRAGVFHHPSNYIASRSRGQAGVTPEQLVSMKQLQPALYGFIADRFNAGQFDNAAMGVIMSEGARAGMDIGRDVVDFHTLDFAGAVRMAQAKVGEDIVRHALSEPEGSTVREHYDKFIANEVLAHIDHQAKGGLIRMPNGTVLPGAADMASYLTGTDNTAAPLGAAFMRFGQEWTDVAAAARENPMLGEHMPMFMEQFGHAETVLGQYADGLANDVDVHRAASSIDVPTLSGMINERTGLPSDLAVVNEGDYLDVLKRLGLDSDALKAEAERFRKGDAVGVGTMFPHGNKNTAFTGVRVLSADTVRGWKGFEDLMVPAGGALMSPELVAMFDKDADGDGFALYAAPGLKGEINMMKDYIRTAWKKPSAEMQGIIKKLGFTLDKYENSEALVDPISGSKLMEQAVTTAKSQARMGKDFNLVRDIHNAASIMSDWVLQNKGAEIADRFLTGAALFGQNVYQLSLDMDESKDAAVGFVQEALFGHTKKKGVYLRPDKSVVATSDDEYAQKTFAGMLRMQMSHRDDPAENRKMYLGQGYSFLTGEQYNTGIIQEHAMMLTPRGMLDNADVAGEVQSALAALFDAGDAGLDAAGRRIMGVFTGKDMSDDTLYTNAVRDYIFGAAEGGASDALLPTAMRAKLAQGSSDSEHVGGMARAANVGKALKSFTEITKFVKGKGGELENFLNLGGTSYMQGAKALYNRVFGNSRTSYKDGWNQVAPGTSFTAGDGGQPEWFLNSATGEMEIIGANGPQEYVANARGSVIPMGQNPAMAETIPVPPPPKQAAVNPQLVNRQQMKKQTQLPPGTPGLPPRTSGNGLPAVGPSGAVVMNLPGAERPGFIGLHAVTGFMRDVTGMGNLMGMVKYDPDVLQRLDFLNNIDKSWSSIDKVRGNIVGIKQYREQMAKHGYETPGFRDFMNPQAFAEMEQFMGGKGVFRAIERFTNIEGMSRAQLEDAFKKGHKDGFVTQLPDFSKMSENQLRGRARAVVGGLMDESGLNANVKQYAQWMQDNESVLTNAKLSQAVGPTPMNRNTVDAAVKSLDHFNKTLEKTGKVTEMSAANARKFGEDLSHIAKQFTDMKQTYDALDMKVSTRHDSLSPAEIDTLGRLSQPDAQRFMTDMQAQLPAIQSDIAQASERMRVRPEDDDVRQYRLRELLGRGGIAGERARHQEREFGDLYKDGLKFEVFGKEFAINDPRKIDQYGSLGRTAEGLKSAFFNYSIIAGSTISPLMKSVDPYFKSQDLMESSLGQLSVFGGNAYTEGPLAHIRQRRAQREQAGITFGESVYRSYSGFFDSAFSESLAGGLGYAASVAAPAATVGMMASSMSKNPNAGAIYGLGSAALLAGANILSGAGDIGRMTDHIANVRGGGALAALSDPLTSLSVLGGAVLNTRGFEIAKSSAEAREGFNAIFTAGGDTVTWNTAIDARARARARDEAFANATPQVLNEWIGWSGIETQEQMAARVMAEGGFDQASFRPDARFVQGAEMDAYAVGVQSLMDNQYMNEDTAARIYTSMRGFGMDMRGFGTSTMASQIASMELQGIDGIGLATQNSMALGQYPTLDTIEGPLKSIGDFITNLAPGTSVAGVTSRIGRSLEYGAQFNNLFEQASMPDYKYDWQTFASRERGTTQDTIAFQEAEAQAFGQVAQLSIADPRSGALALGGVGDYLAKSINDGSFTYSKLSQVTQQSLAAGSLYPQVAQAFPNDPNVWDKLEDLRDMTDRDAFGQAEKMLTQMSGIAEQLNPLLRASGLSEMSAPFILQDETADQVQNRMSVYMAQAGGYQTAQQLKAMNPALGNLGASLITRVDASGNPLDIGRFSQQASTMGSMYQSALSAVPGMVPTYSTGLIGASPEAFAASMSGVQSRIGIAASANPLAFAAGLQGIGAIDIGEYTPEAANSAKIAEMMNGKAFGAIGQMALSLNQDLSGLPQGQRLSAMIDEFSGGAAIDPAKLRAGYQYSSLVGQSAGLFEQYAMRTTSFNTAANLTSIMGIADMGFAPATTLQNALAGDPVAQSRAYAMAPGAPAAWNQIDLRNGLASTTFGLDDNQYSAISNFWNNESSAEGKAFFAQTNQDIRLGSWGLQNQAHQISYRAQMASYGIQAASARTGWAFTSGGYSGLDAQGFALGGDVGKAVGHGINGGNGMGKWQIDDAMTRISREQQQYQYNRQGQELDFADKNKELQISQYMEKFDMGWNWMLKQNKYQRREMNIGRQISLTQRGWAQSDMQMERARGELEFGWQQQDFDRNIRYARGRQKIDLMREKDRSTVRFSLDQNQRDKQEDRFAEEAKWQDERFKREKEHFKETVKHNKEEMQMDKRHFLARMALEEERMARQRQDHELEGQWMQEKWALEDQRRLIDRQEAQINYNYQMASLGVAMQAAIDMEQNRKNQEALAMGWKSVSEKFRLGFDEAIATAVDFINRLKAQFAAGGTRGDGTPEITPDRPSATGGVRKGTFTVGEFGRELVTTDTSVAVLNNRTTEAFFAGAAAAGGGGNHSDALVAEVIALLKIIAKKSPAQINATINTATGKVDLGEYLSAIETRVRT